jgi:hypothetical protein
MSSLKLSIVENQRRSLKLSIVENQDSTAGDLNDIAPEKYFESLFLWIYDKKIKQRKLENRKPLHIVSRSILFIGSEEFTEQRTGSCDSRRETRVWSTFNRDK